jgi:hypothetical protein
MPETKGFKYVYSVGQIDDVLEKIKDTGRPDKLTITYIQNTWLLKNAQYSSVIELLKSMDFLTPDGAPTDSYAKFQNPGLSGKVLAEGVKKAYPSLFKAYPNAQDMPKEKLEGYIKQHTGADKSVVDKIYGTIKRLCSLGDFSAVSTPSTLSAQPASQPPVSPPNLPIPITMNIQIVIPSDATAEQYDKIFSSIKKNLLKS